MARTRKTITLDEKIEKAQEAVEKTKARYDAAVKELRALLEKKDAQRKQELLKALENSSRSFDEIMEFLKAEE